MGKYGFSIKLEPYLDGGAKAFLVSTIPWCSGIDRE